MLGFARLPVVVQETWTLLLDSEHAIKSDTAYFFPFVHHVSLMALAILHYSSGTPDWFPGYARRQVRPGTSPGWKVTSQSNAHHKMISSFF